MSVVVCARDGCVVLVVAVCGFLRPPGMRTKKIGLGVAVLIALCLHLILRGHDLHEAHEARARTQSAPAENVSKRDVEGLPASAVDLRTNELAFPCEVHVHPDRITVSKGGEPIADVLGRAEKAEYPVYQQAALEVACHEQRHGLEAGHFKHMRKGMNVDRALASEKCTSAHGVESRPAVMVMRYEYANLYHTFNDWYSLYQSMRAHKLEYGAFDLVWLDGHAWGNLDQAWAEIFSPRVSHIAQTRGCYNPVYCPADGGKADLFAGCINTPSAQGFVDYVLQRYDLRHIPKRKQILIVDRQPYLSHPRLKQPLPSVVSAPGAAHRCPCGPAELCVAVSPDV